MAKQDQPNVPAAESKTEPSPARAPEQATERSGSRGKTIAAWAAGLAVVSAAAYAGLVRPWHRQWGSTREEAEKPLPGDELVPQPKVSATHAITIHASPAEIWPWLVQMGQGRGGFYSYERLVNLFGSRIRNAGEILPELQALKVGDEVMVHPRMAPLAVAILTPERTLVLHLDTRTGPRLLGMKSGDYENLVWGFHLEPAEGGSTRLVERFRSDHNPSALNSLTSRLVLEPASFLMERKMLQGIKERAEGAKLAQPAARLQ
jgi:hypothetical protein